MENVARCDISYNIDILSGRDVTIFDEKCLNNSLSFLNKISFKNGEIDGEKLIVDSQEYNYCLNIKNTKGLVEHKKCIKEILPILKEKYPEVQK